MDFAQLKSALIEEVNFLRSVTERVIVKDDFKEMWAKSDSALRSKFIRAVKTRDRDEVDKWLTEHPKRDLEIMTKPELLHIATVYSIPYRTQMSKFQLINAINKAKQDAKDKSTADKRAEELSDRKTDLEGVDVT